MIVYLITNRVNGKYYVGQTTMSLAEKLNWYRSERRVNRVPPFLARAIKKHGAENFSIACVAVARTKSELDALEKLWIWALQSTDPNTGYNLTAGGTGGAMVGEALEKLRRPKSVAHRQKLSEIRKAMGPTSTAHMNTPEIQRRKSVKLTGRKFSEETRRKMSASAQRRITEGRDSLTVARAARGPQHRDVFTGQFAPTSVMGGYVSNGNHTTCG